MVSMELEKEVLQKIGRSVVNFQKLEGMLKSLSWVSRYSGTPADIQRQHAKHTDALRKKSLGLVVSDFFEKIYVDSGSRDAESQASDYGLRFSIPDGERERLKALLVTIVQERNELIHTRLLNFDSQSTQSCTDLNAFLDKQHERITPALKEIWLLANNMKKHRAAFMELTSADMQVDDGGTSKH